MKRILIIEDDTTILKGLTIALEENNFTVNTESDGEKGFKTASTEKNDLIILDLILPGKNGLDICKELRSKGVSVPILMLTSKKEELDKVLGLEIGADDYVTKPFSIRELVARVNALLRRKSELVSKIEKYTFDNVIIDFKRQEAIKGHFNLSLSSTEYKIMQYFIQHEGEVISRDQLLDDVWGYDVFPTTRTVDNYILSLRKKIESNPSSPKHLLTIYKGGYKFVK